MYSAMQRATVQISRLGGGALEQADRDDPLGEQSLELFGVRLGLVVHIESRPQGLWQELVGDPDLEAAGGSFFDRRHTPIVKMGRGDVNGRLAV
jgi:hypothetical protein